MKLVEDDHSIAVSCIDYLSNEILTSNANFIFFSEKNDNNKKKILEKFIFVIELVLTDQQIS